MKNARDIQQTRIYPWFGTRSALKTPPRNAKCSAEGWRHRENGANSQLPKIAVYLKGYLCGDKGKVVLVSSLQVSSLHFAQTSVQNPTRDPSAPSPAWEGHESKLFQKARAGGTLGQLFYFCFQMVSPWPVGRAQLPINSPWPAPSFLTGDVKHGSRKQSQSSTARCGEEENGYIKKHHWAGLSDELAQPACPCLQQMSRIHLSPVLFSTGGWIGKSSTLEVFSQEGAVLSLFTERGDQL